MDVLKNTVIAIKYLFYLAKYFSRIKLLLYMNLSLFVLLIKLLGRS